MPTRSKFTSERRGRILEVLAVGGSRRTAAAVAGIDHTTLSRWLERGRRGSPLGRWRAFLRDVEEAEKNPQLRALTEEYDKAQDSPWAAFRFLDRHDAWAEDEPPLPADPVVIRLELTDKSPPVLGSGFEGEE